MLLWPKRAEKIHRRALKARPGGGFVYKQGVSALRILIWFWSHDEAKEKPQKAVP